LNFFDVTGTLARFNFNLKGVSSPLNSRGSFLQSDMPTNDTSAATAAQKTKVIFIFRLL